MASTFLELYSDFQDEVKLYTEKLDVTELSFMRRLTKGIQIFQQETQYVETIVSIVKNSNNQFVMPYDVSMIIKIELVGNERFQFIPNEFMQLSENIERSNGLFRESIPNYEINKRYSKVGTVLYSLHGRQFFFSHSIPDDAVLRIFYIPDLSPISSSSTLWTTPDDTTTTPPTIRNWFPNDQLIVDPVTGNQVSRLLYMMQNNRVLSPLNLYEDAFVDYAVATYVRSKGSVNYKVYEKDFYSKIQLAKLAKPTFFQEGSADYNFAPFS